MIKYTWAGRADPFAWEKKHLSASSRFLSRKISCHETLKTYQRLSATLPTYDHYELWDNVIIILTVLLYYFKSDGII